MEIERSGPAHRGFSVRLMNRVVLFSLFCVGAALWGCAIPQQLELIEREQRRLRSEDAALRARTDGIREEMEKVRSSLADAHANLQKISQDLNQLQGQLEEARFQLTSQVGRSAREKDERVKALEAEIAKVREELKSQGALLKASEEELRSLREALLKRPPSKAEAAPREKVTAERQKEEYEATLALLERKEYRTMITRLRDFIKKYPTSDLADNAQYWIGEAYYALREFDQAILEFDEVRRRYPKGDKVPAALLKQAFAFAELGDKVDARLILRDLIDRYPQTPEALKAEQKLKELEVVTGK